MEHLTDNKIKFEIVAEDVLETLPATMQSAYDGGISS